MNDDPIHGRRFTDQSPQGLSDDQSAEHHSEQMSGITDIEARLDAHTRSLASGDARMTRIEAKLDANNSATQEVLDILILGKAFFRLAGGVGSFIKWATAIGAPVVAFWYALKGGKS